jgi:hypothetical protein
VFNPWHGVRPQSIHNNNISIIGMVMAYNSETSDRRSAALRMILGSGGTLILLLLVLMLIRPDMAMSALHHVAAMIGMDAGAGH